LFILWPVLFVLWPVLFVLEGLAAQDWAVENQATAGKGLPSDFVSPFDSLVSETDAATA
jgi:hypothetical protein